MIEHAGSFYFPTEALLCELQGIPENMKLDAVSGSQASEIIGQSIDGRMHDQLIDAIKRHIDMSLEILNTDYAKSA